jgi:hypothetical protein
MSQLNRVLLVNDTRGAQEYLLRAFREMGLHCDLATFGWQTIEPMANALNFDPLRSWGMVGKVSRPLINLLNVKRLASYDVASYVHRISFVDRPHVLRYRDLPAVREKVRVMSYTALGCDELAFIAGNPLLPYKPCDTCQKYDDPERYCEKVVRPMNKTAFENLNTFFDHAVSTGFEYSHIESHFLKPVARIGLPVDVSEVPWKPSGAQTGTLKILHTPSRGGFKGTAVVLEAIEHLKAMRSDFEFSVVTGVPFHEYIRMVGEADVIVDQVWSQSPGMNALWLMAMGKVVFSGNTPLCQNYLPHADESPILDASPDPQQLAVDLSDAISKRQRFASIAEQGREYVTRRHGHMKIAAQYLSLWQGAL